MEPTLHQGDVLLVSGADLLDGTPIYDIKPYLAFTDSHPDAVGGFADGVREYKLAVEFPGELSALIEKEKLSGLVALLENDPRPSYQDDPDRIYGMLFSDREIKFRVEGDTLTVVDVI